MSFRNLGNHYKPFKFLTPIASNLLHKGFERNVFLILQEKVIKVKT